MQMTVCYEKIRFGGYCLRVLPEFYHEEFLKVCCRGDGARSGWERVSSSPYASVNRFGHRGELYYHKRYLRRGSLEQIKALVFGSRAERAWRGGCLLQDCGLGVPETVVAGWRYSDCFTVTRAITEEWRLGQYVQRMHATADRRARCRIAMELGRTVGKMHRQGIAHGDLRWGNILVLEGDTGGIELVFLDNERTRRYRRLSRREVLKNLVQLNMVPSGLLSRTDRLRFWRAYQAESGMAGDEQKPWMRRILARTAWRWKRRAKKGRDPQIESGSDMSLREIRFPDGSATGDHHESVQDGRW